MKKIWIAKAHVVKDADGSVVATCGGSSLDQKYENAAMIAASPKLLEALRGLLREHDAITIANGGKPGVSDRWPDRAKAARDAIEAATGVRP